MTAQKDYGGVVWTNHAMDRLKERGIEQGDAWATWSSPDSSQFAKSRGGWVYKKRFGGQEIEVVAKKNEKDKWIILSVWSKYVRSYKKKDKFNFSDFLRKILG
jgi:hypothetical protein